MERSAYVALRQELASLTVFRQLLSDPVLSALCRYLDTLPADDTCASVSAYAGFVDALYTANGGDLPRYMDAVCGNCETVYVRTVGCGGTPPAYITACVQRELAILSRVASLTPENLTAGLGYGGELPCFASAPTDLAGSYAHRVENIGKYGYGKYAANRMFFIDDQSRILPVAHPDSIRLDALVDYESERGRVLENTRALLAGKPAANILLTGDAGTGKSSTVKAVGNELFAEGLRIIEVRRNQLTLIPHILDELSDNPLKFILFIDDLSFLKDDDQFSTFKAVLEGSVSARSGNVVIYATSNRRHIIKETFSDRDGDEVHRNDTMQELISLSARFGMHITFGKPDKQTYLHIVHNLAESAHLSLEPAELELQAERFALEKGGRSARCARQFVDSLLAAQ